LRRFHTFGVLGIPVEVLVTGDTPDVGGDAIVRFQDIPGFEALVENGAAAQQVCPTPLAFLRDEWENL
jgi:hypothetical protein